MTHRTANLGIAAAVIFLAGSAGTVRAQNGDTGKNAPPRHYTLGPVATPGVIVAEVWEGKVTRVVDGNTLLVERANRKEADKSESVLVRLWGVVVPTSDAEAMAAKSYVEKSVGGKTVRVQAQARAKNADLLADVFALPDKPRYGAPRGRLREINDPTSTTQPRPLTEPDLPLNFPNLNEGLVRAGLARWDKAGAGQADNLARAQAGAQKDKVGLWADTIAGADIKSGTATSAEKPAVEPRRP